MGDGPNPKAKWSKYKVEDGKLVRAEHCPNCGPGVFLAIHNTHQRIAGSELFLEPRIVARNHCSRGCDLTRSFPYCWCFWGGRYFGMSGSSFNSCWRRQYRR